MRLLLFILLLVFFSCDNDDQLNLEKVRVYSGGFDRKHPVRLSKDDLLNYQYAEISDEMCLNLVEECVQSMDRRLITSCHPDLHSLCELYLKSGEVYFLEISSESIYFKNSCFDLDTSLLNIIKNCSLKEYLEKN